MFCVLFGHRLIKIIFLIFQKNNKSVVITKHYE